MNLILTVIWIYTPALFANIFAAVSKHIPHTAFLAKPVDFGKSWKGIRVLGDGKTFRGFIFGVTASIIIVFLQQSISDTEFFENILEVDYLSFNPLIWGFVVGFGALLGDAIESFFKRRVGIARGEPWFPFDQIDFAIGTSIVSLLYKQFPIKIYLIVIFSFFILHLIGKFVGYKLKLDDKPF
jgi:CDP-2,3-bis-(O-geranylgeranyl)-sn-glycerol synthase